jgi:hypothetical protein
MQQWVFSLGSVPVMTSCNSRGSEAVFSLGSVHGLYSSGIYGTVPVTSLKLAVTRKYSGRAADFREELQSCRRTDPAILEDRQPVKIQCEDSASVIVNCSEL